MSRNFRALVLWLIAVAIPVQGIAAIVTRLCVPAISATVADVGLGQAGAMMMHGHRAAPEAGFMAHVDDPGHGHAVEAHGPGDFTAPDADPAGHAGHAGHGMLKCCSAGCSMVACFATCLATPTDAPSLAPVQSEASFYPGVILESLDRPPRLLLA